MKRLIPLAAILAIAIGAAYFINTSTSSKKSVVQLLPYYGEKELRPNGDTVFHSVNPFSFTNQLGETVTEKTLDNTNYVVEYFFTNCKSICPIMNKNMMKVAEKIKGDKGFKILSHTVKPEEDSVPQMLKYAQSHNADNSQWYFLTGDKKELYAMARNSYLLNTDTTTTQKIEDDFIHTQMFVLVDKNRHIRGYYDGTSDMEVANLLRDIDKLRKEQEENKKN
jgi:protein SCO1